jgi:Recombination endonuclease VII
MKALPPTRSAALALGLKHYFTGKPCSNGHTSRRHLTGTCVDCQQAANKRWADRNPEESARRTRDWQKNNPERTRVKNLRWKRKQMGIPEATRLCPLNCECCGNILISGKRTHLDHDHATGKFRGWLCNSCNLGIGALGDSIEGIRKALTYLECAHITSSRLA